MWRHSFRVALLSVLVQDDDESTWRLLGLKAVSAQYGGRYEQTERMNRQRQQERDYFNQQGNPYANFGGGNFDGNFGGGYEKAPEDVVYYKALNVTPDATDKEIKASYRKLALVLHPDKFKPRPGVSDQTNEKDRAKQQERFQKIQQAYDVLGDEKKKRIYDKHGMRGLDMLAKGRDPEESGGFNFGGFGDFGKHFNAHGMPNYSQADAQRMFEEMAKMYGMGGMGGMPNMGGFNGMPNMGGFNMGGFEQMFQGSGMPNMGSFNMGGGFPGGIPNMNGFNMGGFPGGGFPGGGSGGQRQRHTETRRPKEPEDAPPAFAKGEESGVVPLGEEKFPDARSKHAWLIYFYDKNNVSRDPTTKEYVDVAKQLSSTLLKKAKGKKDGVTFKVGAVDCSREQMAYCESKLGAGVEVPTFATVFNGNVAVIPEDNLLKDARYFHDKTIDALSKIEGLVVNVNSVQHIQTRLLGSSPSPGQKTIAILLFTDKYETPVMFKSLAYRHRRDGFVFGESRAKNLHMSKEFNIKNYPTVLAIIGDSDSQLVEKFEGKSMDSDSISKWIDTVGKKHFKYGSREARSS